LPEVCNLTPVKNCNFSPVLTVELAMGDEAAMVIKNGKKVGFAHLAIHIDLRSVHTV
jgi:hypothetical protein